MLIRNLIVVVLILSISKGYAQNLIINGNFEQKINNTSTSITNAPPWSGISTPDYYSQDIGNIPNNMAGTQIPQNGDSYSGITLYAITSPPSVYNFREFLIAQLQTSLVTNQKYCLTYYVSLADTINYAINRIGAYFSDTLINPTSPAAPYLTFVQPHVEADSLLFYNNKNSWMKIEGSYIAIGGENYITIGNFYLDNQTDTLYSNVGSMLPLSQKQSYYYLDNFSLEFIKPVDAGADISIIDGDSTVIGNNLDSGSTYTWSPNYYIDDTSSANPKVYPPLTTTYYVTKTQCNVTTIDSITVTVTPTGVNEFSDGIKVTLYPNPNNGNFKLTHNLKNKNNVLLEIIDVTGKVVLKKDVTTTNNVIKINTTNLHTGIYFLSMLNSDGKLLYYSKISVIN